jgi:thiol-disulfide isomerase/thioredoxin
MVILSIVLGRSNGLTQDIPPMDSVATVAQLKATVLSNDSMDIFYVYHAYCGPCRQTIPTLHEFAPAHPDFPVRYWFVSIDRDSAQWRRLADRVRTGWVQVFVPDVERATFEKALRIQPIEAVPTIIWRRPGQKKPFVTNSMLILDREMREFQAKQGH